MKQQVLDCFAKLFGGEGDIRTYFAPGRVNLIGEHTDYNTQNETTKTTHQKEKETTK